MFFPDPCEIAYYSVFAGLPLTLGNSTVTTIFMPVWALGLQAGAFGGFEVAKYTGPGPANAASFAGIFYTANVSGMVYGIPVGAGTYVGIPTPSGVWLGGVFGIAPGLPMLSNPFVTGLGILVWLYTPHFVINLSSYPGGTCLCYSWTLGLF